MMNSVCKVSMTFIVTNTQRLEVGSAARINWSKSGGTIGCSSSATWQLKDSIGNISDLHCEVVVIDHAFCLKDLCGETYINHSTMPIGLGKIAKLKHKDEIRIGSYWIKVLNGDMYNSHDVERQLDELLQSHPNELNLDCVFSHSDRGQQITVNVPDPISMLDSLHTKDTSLIAEDKPNSTNSLFIGGLIPNLALDNDERSFTFSSDTDFDIRSSMYFKNRSRLDTSVATPNDTEDRYLVQTDRYVSRELDMYKQEFNLLKDGAEKRVKTQAEQQDGFDKLLLELFDSSHDRSFRVKQGE